jgi:hypothetical protein
MCDHTRDVLVSVHDAATFETKTEPTIGFAPEPEK